MDCFLAWTMPIYFGCKQLGQFFPQDSFVQLDPAMDDPVAFLRNVIRSDRRERNLEAIAEARRRVLYDWNLFELIVKELETDRPRSLGIPKLISDHTRGRIQFVPRRLLGPVMAIRRRLKGLGL